MSKLPLSQPLKDGPSFITALNRFVLDVSTLFNKRLTIKDNIDGDLLTVTVEGTFPIYVPWTRNSPPIAVWIGQFREATGTHTIPTISVGLDWEYKSDTKQIQINGLPGSSTSTTNKFKLTLVGITG